MLGTWGTRRAGTIGGIASEDYCATKKGINLQAPAATCGGAAAHFRSHGVRGLPPYAKYAKDGAPGLSSILY